MVTYILMYPNKHTSKFHRKIHHIKYHEEYYLLFLRHSWIILFFKVLHEDMVFICSGNLFQCRTPLTVIHCCACDVLHKGSIRSFGLREFLLAVTWKLPSILLEFIALCTNMHVCKYKISCNLSSLSSLNIGSVWAKRWLQVITRNNFFWITKRLSMYVLHVPPHTVEQYRK